MATRFYSSIEYGRKDDGNNDPDVLYYNASIINNTTRSDGNNYDDPQVVFNEVRQYPLLSDTSDYMMSVVRFSMNGATKNLPLFIPRIDPTQTNVNQTVYKIRAIGTIVGAPTPGFDVTVPIIFTPENLGTQPPISTSPQNLNSNYYYVYTYSHFCQLVNTAFANLLTAVNTATGGATQSRAPVLTYNPVTRLFSFNCDARFWGQTATSPGVESWSLWIEENLDSLLTNFQAEYYGIQGGNPTLEGWNEIIIGNPANTTYEVLLNPATGAPYSPPAGYVNVVVTQDYPSTSGAWSPVDTICITSSLLPLTPEQVSPPQEVGSTNIGWASEVAQSGFQTIATDIAIKLQGAEDYRQFILYEPTAEYRMVALNTSRQPLQNIDFQVWWRNRLDNNLYPLRLYNGTSVSLKVMFRRKQLGV